jgi:hypothetical protein
MGKVITKSSASFGENSQQNAWQTRAFLLLWVVLEVVLCDFSPRPAVMEAFD